MLSEGNSFGATYGGGGCCVALALALAAAAAAAFALALSSPIPEVMALLLVLHSRHSVAQYAAERSTSGCSCNGTQLSDSTLPELASAAALVTQVTAATAAVLLAVVVRAVRNSVVCSSSST
jgi:hypothetical protein